MQQSKHNFLYPRAHYRGAVKPEHLLLNANLQEFAQRVSDICNLQTVGKLSPDQAFEQIEISPRRAMARLYIIYFRLAYCDRISFTLLSRGQLFDSNAANLDGNRV